MSQFEEHALATALRRIDPGPGGIDAAEAAVLGRRRQRRSRALAAAGSATCAALAAVTVIVAMSAAAPRPRPPVVVPTVPPASDGACTVAYAPSYGEDNLPITAADPTLRYVVGGDIRWDGGQPTRLPHSGGTMGAADVNSAGVVVGTLHYGGPGVPGTNTPWTYSGGVVTPLPLPPGYASGSVSAINASGDMVGHAGVDPGAVVPVRWHDGRVGVLPLPAGSSGGRAIDIADDGTILGVFTRDVRDHPYALELPYLWRPSGAGLTLTVPTGGGAFPDQVGGAVAVGVVYQSAKYGTGNVVARWNVTTGAVELLKAFPADGVRTDAGGDLVSEGRTVAYTSRLLRRGTKTPVVLPLPANATLDEGFYADAVAISPDGRKIIGLLNGPAGVVIGPNILIWSC